MLTFTFILRGQFLLPQRANFECQRAIAPPFTVRLFQSGFGQISLCDGTRVVGHFCEGTLHGPALFHADRGRRISGSFWSGVEEEQGAAFTKGFYTGVTKIRRAN